MGIRYTEWIYVWRFPVYRPDSSCTGEDEDGDEDEDEDEDDEGSDRRGLRGAPKATWTFVPCLEQ